MTKFPSSGECSQCPKQFSLVLWHLRDRATIGAMAIWFLALTDNSVSLANAHINPSISMPIAHNASISDQPSQTSEIPDPPQGPPLRTELPTLELRVEPKVDFKPDSKVDPTINLIKPKVPVPTDSPTIVEPIEPGSDPELGTLKIRKTPLSSPPPAPPRATSLYLLGNFNYFQTTNVFSSIPLQTDGAARTGLSLYYLPPLGPKTYLLVLAESSILRYGTSSRLNYDELGLKVGLYHQLTPRLSGEIGWGYQQLTTAQEGVKNLFQGVRFFNEHSLRFDLTRQDALSPSLKLITAYQFRWNFTGDVEKYDRLLNAGQISLSYKLSPPMAVGLVYHASWTHFTQQSRDDVSHYLGAHLTYELNDRMSFSAFGGRSLGVSSEQRIAPNSWFFGVGFNFNIAIF